MMAGGGGDAALDALMTWIFSRTVVRHFQLRPGPSLYGCALEIGALFPSEHIRQA